MTGKSRPAKDISAQETLPQQQKEIAATDKPDSSGATVQDELLRDTASISSESISSQNIPPPAFGDIFGEIRSEDNGLHTSALITDNGRVNIHINQLNRRLSQVFTPALRQYIQGAQESSLPPAPYIPPSLGGEEGGPPPPLNIVIHVVGSRGDVQPFIALGNVLRKTYGHRVRLATHTNFKGFVEEYGLEFFSIGGDPSRLMAFMVKNPGLIGARSIANGDVAQRRRDVAEYLQGCWRSCYQAGDGMEFDISEEATKQSDSNADPQPGSKPFVADCIIANPPSFAHIHCAEKLGIPLHIMFTMPYSPTQAFPHPLANIRSSNADPQLTNYISYSMIEILSWQGLGDIINRFRARCLGLDAVSLIWAPGMLQRLKIPHSYCWSPTLIPKPKDWGSHISVSGFHFLGNSDYAPSPDLQSFLNAGPAPVYIGFGSIVLDDPDAMTELIFEAVRKSGQRALISRGWGGIGERYVPNDIFMLGNVPHNWLFNHVSCVVHHGGAGTTAAGIAAGRPTVIVPFFGDQPFWGAMVAHAGAGPSPIPHKQLTAETLADAIEFCLKPESLERARNLANNIGTERGSDMSAQSFHRFLEPDRLRCALAPSRAATWRIKRTKIQLSAFAACTLVNANFLDFHDLKLFRPLEYETDEGPWDPITGGFVAACGAFGGMAKGLADIPTETYKALQLPFKDSRQRSKMPLKTTDSRHTIEDANGQRSMSPTSHGPNQTNLSIQNPDDSIGKESSLSSASMLSKDPKIKTGATRNGNNRDMLQRTGPHTSKGVGGFARALAQGPMDVSMGFSKGLYNLPKLWGDDTIRRSSQVTDFTSGAKAAGKEFGLAWYDGITGLATQPWHGAKKEGAGGFFKGIGRGVGGFLTKPTAAIFGVPGYMMKGVHKGAQNLIRGNIQDYIIASRTAQGYEEWLQSSEAEKQDVIERWKLIQKYLKKRRHSKETHEAIIDLLAVQRKMQSDVERPSRQPERDDASSVASLSSFVRDSSSTEAEAEAAGREENVQINSEVHDSDAQLEQQQLRQRRQKEPEDII